MCFLRLFVFPLFLVVSSTDILTIVAPDRECASSGTEENFDCNGVQSLLQTQHELNEVEVTVSPSVGERNPISLRQGGSFPKPRLPAFGKKKTNADKAHGANEKAHGANEKVYYAQRLNNALMMDLQYTADLIIGGQKTKGVLDTGSFELLVFGKECSACGIGAKYDHSKSTTYASAPGETEHEFGSGATLSREGYEQVVTGPLVAENLSFWEVVDADMPVLGVSNFGAIVGIGPPGEPLKEAEMEAEEIHALANQFNTEGDDPKDAGSGGYGGPEALQDILKKLEDESDAAVEYAAQRNDSLLEAFGTTEFSICLEEESGAPGWFGWNDNNFSVKPKLFTSLSLAGSLTWSAKMTSAHLEGGSAAKDTIGIGCDDGCAAIVDSGTSLLVVPTEVEKAIKDALGDLSAYDNNCTYIEESLLPDLHFKLAGKTYSLPPDAYLAYVLDDPVDALRRIKKGEPMRCKLELAVMGEDIETEFGPLWILGMPFFRKYITTFELGKGKSGRNRMHTAVSDGHCNLLDEGKSVLMQKRTKPRMINRNNVTISPSVRKAIRKGYLHM